MILLKKKSLLLMFMIKSTRKHELLEEVKQESTSTNYTFQEDAWITRAFLSLHEDPITEVGQKA
jgi:hypothetical protein